jgi:hypothetical protein
MSGDYELWDTVSGNLVDVFDSEAEAATAIRHACRGRGPDALEGLVLSRGGPGGAVIARGIELVHLLGVER